MLDAYRLGYSCETVGGSLILHADCFEWLSKCPENSVHAIVTDPPYGVKEFEDIELHKKQKGVGGIWRLPPSFDGHVRAPLPRFTALNAKERKVLKTFFIEWSILATRALRPGGHVFIATNTFLSQSVFAALIEGGLEFRGELIRLVRTLRGGDRPKNAESEFPGVSSLPRGCYEPWGILRKPLPAGMKVSECLREFETGGLRRRQSDLPFEDVIRSERTPKIERDIGQHPSIKPQSLLRKIVHAALPLGKGVILDPFMGSGSTIAAADAMGLYSVGIERYADYYALARKAIPKLTRIKTKVETTEPLLF